MTLKSSTTKRPIVDEHRHLTNQEYNILMNHAGTNDRRKDLAVDTYRRLVAAGYSTQGAIEAVKKAFLFDVTDHI